MQIFMRLFIIFFLLAFFSKRHIQSKKYCCLFVFYIIGFCCILTWLMHTFNRFEIAAGID